MSFYSPELTEEKQTDVVFSPPSQGCLEAVFSRQEEVDRLSSLAQQVLEETYISSRVSMTATQLTARYHSLLLTVQVGHLLLLHLGFSPVLPIRLRLFSVTPRRS